MKRVGTLINLLDELKSRRVAFQSVTEAIDTTTLTVRAMWQMVGILAELERSLIQERTKAESGGGCCPWCENGEK